MKKQKKIATFHENVAQDTNIVHRIWRRWSQDVESSRPPLLSLANNCRHCVQRLIRTWQSRLILKLSTAWGMANFFSLSFKTFYCSYKSNLRTSLTDPHNAKLTFHSNNTNLPEPQHYLTAAGENDVLNTILYTLL